MPRRTPRQSRSRALVEAILEGALQVIGKADVLQGVTTKTVARRAGVSIGSLYQYFPNKDELFSSLIERQLASQEQRFAEVIAGAEGESIEELIRAFLVEANLLYDRTPALTKLFIEATRLGAVPAMAETRTKISKMLAVALGECGTFVEPLEPRVELLIHAVMGVYEAQALRPGTLDALPSLEDELQTLCRAYIGAITSEGPPAESN